MSTDARPAAPTSAAPDPTRAAVRALARIEARRVLRHPAPWLGLLGSLFWARSATAEQTWASAQYEGLTTAVTPLLAGISLAALSCFGRARVPVADEAPLPQEARSWGRLLGMLPLVGVTVLVVLATVVWVRLRDGLPLGDEPGHTAHAHHTLPELLQPVLLSMFAVALGAAVVHVVRQRLAATIVLVLGWFVVGATYWVFTSGVLTWLTPLQVQPVDLEVAPRSTDPTTLPADWLLSAPGEFQEGWNRLVVSPALAGWHDVYVVGLTALLLAVAVPGRTRRLLLPVGAVLVVAGVALQWVVAP